METAPTQNLDDQLYVRGRPLPEWATWLIRVGGWARGRAGDEIVVGVSVPVRSYAAAFLMLGAHDLGARSALPASIDQAMALINRWGIGADVSFDFRGRRHEGTISSVTADHVEVATHDSVCSVPRGKVLSIDRLPEGLEPGRRARPLKDVASLRSALYPGDPLGRIGSSRVECLVLGLKASLEEELSLRVDMVGTRFSGSLSDLICPRSLLPPKSAFRTEALSSNVKSLPGYLAVTPPSVVVLDGAGASLDWLGRLTRVPVIAIVDRSEARAADAAAMLLGRRAAAGAWTIPLDLPTPPPEFELIAYGKGAVR